MHRGPHMSGRHLLRACLPVIGVAAFMSAMTICAPAHAAAGRLSLDHLLGGPWPSPPPPSVTPAQLPPTAVPADLVDLATRGTSRTLAWAFPVRKGTPISGTFGERGVYWPTGHAGIDFDGALGDPVFAAINGRVIFAGFNSGGYGNLIITRRGDGTEVRYAHLDHIGVERGDRVRAGTRIGRMGSTGQTTGVHLHLEIRVNGGVTPTDPTSVWSGKRPGVPATPPAWSCAKYGGCTDQDRRSTGA